MSCSYEDIKRMFDEGVKLAGESGVTHMVVARDDFDYSCYPVYTHEPAKTVLELREQNEMTSVMEVYDLREEFEFQQTRRSVEGMVWNMPDWWDKEEVSIPFLAVGNDELGGPVGDTATCPNCGQQHPVRYGDSVSYAPTGEKVLTPSTMLGFVECGERQFLVALDGRALPPRGRAQS